MTGKKWFYWLGKLHGHRKFGIPVKPNWPDWACEAYADGWWNGYNEVSQ
jgi:hypothetical protein